MPDQEQQPPANQPSQPPAHELLALLARLSRFAKPKTLAELRELGMILVAIMYIIGYVTWSAYAYQIGLGPMPALDAQYFVAGALILILFGASIAIMLLLHYIPLPTHLQTATFKGMIGCLILIAFIGGTLFVVAFILGLEHFTK